MARRYLAPIGLFLLLLSLGFVVIGGAPAPVSAHAHLERSDPPRGSIQPSAPERVDLWFSEGIDAKGSSIEVYDERRQRVDQGDARVDPGDGTRLSVSLGELVDGTYTVAWTATSMGDGHTIGGTLTFRVGQSRVPGAAATESSSPSPGAIALRWVNLIGLSAVVGWFLLRALGLADDERRRRLALAGAVAALAADLLLVAVQAYWPAEGEATRSLAEAARGMHWSWAARALIELGLIGLLLAGARTLNLSGLVFSVAAVLSLTLTSHAAAADRLRAPAMVANALHLESVALWIGGVIQLALLPKGERLASSATRQFSALAVILAPLAIVTGVLNAGVTLPSVDSLRSSSYGRILVAKSAVVLAILAFGWLNRRRIAAGLEQLLRAARSLRAEAALGGTAILLAAMLALWATPAAVEEEPLHLQAEAGPGRFAHLRMTSPSTGDRQFDLWLSDSTDKPLPGVERVLLTLSMLERPVDLATVRAEPAGDGRWTAPRVPVTIKGWWQADVRFEGASFDPMTARFFLLLPDPTLADGELDRTENPDARQLFKDAIARITTLTSVSVDEQLSDGVGNSVTTSYSYAAPNRLRYVTGSGHESVAIGDTQYYREEGGSWTRRERVTPLAFPEAWPGFYSGAQEFSLGRTQEIDGELCQLIAFSVPEVQGRSAAWYLWWVGLDSKLVRQETMVAYYHYMTSHYRAHNLPVQIEAPLVASP